jgi:hypothetical protein
LLETVGHPTEDLLLGGLVLRHGEVLDGPGEAVVAPEGGMEGVQVESYDVTRAALHHHGREVVVAGPLVSPHVRSGVVAMGAWHEAQRPLRSPEGAEIGGELDPGHTDAIVVMPAGTYYVFAGGRAFAVPTPAALTAVQVSDRAKTLIGPVSPAQIGSGIANGTLLSAPGGAYVGYEGNAYPFMAMSQLAEDGYSGTAAVPVPATGGVNVVFPYSGS